MSDRSAAPAARCDEPARIDGEVLDVGYGTVRCSRPVGHGKQHEWRHGTTVVQWEDTYL